MGSYLSEPITEKVSIDEFNDKLNCGASSMQGWRQSQEDAHNVILDFDKNTSLFAVYDGHGGHEVALYCSMKLPDFLKSLEAYKSGNYTSALEEAFLGFDATITKQEVIDLLKELATSKDDADESDEDEESVNNLYEEAQMPIEKVIERYNLMNPNLKNLKEGDKPPVSPFLKGKSKENTDGVSSSSSGSVNSSDSKSDENGVKLPVIIVTPDSSAETDCTPSSVVDAKDVKVDAVKNGDIADSKSEDVTSSSASVENGDASKKGKALAKTRGAKPLNRKERPKRKVVQQMYKKLLDFEEESEDEEDKTFEEPNDESSDEEGDGDEPAGNEDDVDSSDEDEEDEMDGEEDTEFARNMREEPGSDSGCTAVVALLRGNNLYVANAGDSRCIVCRNGKAVEMSIDHKPEDDVERERVVKAGGKVTSDGRVNGGLNLSRAIGDHAYKQNKELGDKEQMITALPDVRTLTINPSEDEFMVLACDGIWNFMSSQEVVDFVRPGIQEGKSLSKICEEMFDHCLAPNTMGDGTGCDNMTAIIVQLKPTLKRSAESAEESENKRTKTDSTSPKAVE